METHQVLVDILAGIASHFRLSFWVKLIVDAGGKESGNKKMESM